MYLYLIFFHLSVILKQGGVISHDLRLVPAAQGGIGRVRCANQTRVRKASAYRDRLTANAG